MQTEYFILTPAGVKSNAESTYCTDSKKIKKIVQTYSKHHKAI
jgi:hypothetical protein